MVYNPVIHNSRIALDISCMVKMFKGYALDIPFISTAITGSLEKNICNPSGFLTNLGLSKVGKDPFGKTIWISERSTDRFRVSVFHVKGRFLKLC